MKPSVSFVLPYYRVDGLLLKRCLESLLALPEMIDYEIIIVDDGTPGTSVPDWLAKWKMNSRVRYFYQENKGPGGARNAGLSLAEKEYVQFVASNGLVNLDTTLDTVEYSISVDPKMSFKLESGKGVEVWYFVTYESYGKTIRERGSVTLTADAE